MTREEIMIAKPDPAPFAKPLRDPAKLADVEAALRQVLRAPVKSVVKCENREPTIAESNQRRRLTWRS